MAEELKEAGNKVVPVDIVAEMKESYIDYAMSVIIARALPDVRDGLKPVHRRILYAMHKMGLTAGAKFRKSATVVGEVLGNYHPHGDIACYDALVRLTQEFNMLHPLVQGQGNFGSLDGDPPAAMRYTETKLAALSNLLLDDIEKETVDFVPNYDNRLLEPALLPAAFPNLLVNGTVGIAVGMATRVPPHNLGEVMDALVHLLENPEAAAEDLFKFVKGPDFPTGGVIYNEQDIFHAAATGRGGVLLRGETEITEDKKGQSQIIITSIPYQVNKADLIVKIADLVREKKLEGIRDIREESTTLDDIRIVIELKQGVVPEKIRNALYKHTELETVFHYNLLAIVDGVPKLLSLKAMLTEFIKHRQVIVTRRAKFDLARAEERAHILEGLQRAIDIIDEIIATIRKSDDAAMARERLIKKFDFSEPQADAILEMRLQKLAGLEIKKVLEELAEKRGIIKELKALLGSPEKLRALIKTEFIKTRDSHAQPRRTKVVRHGVKEINIEDLVPEKENVLVLTAGGYVKRTDPEEYRVQRRGGVGVVDLDVKEEDMVTSLLVANSHSNLLFFTDRGKVYQIKMYELPEGKRATRGKALVNFLPLADNERVTAVLPVPKQTKSAGVMLVTKRGVGKKVLFENFADVRRSGIIAIRLDQGDALLAALLVSGGDEVLLATSAGQAIRFKEKDLRPMGRAAGGVRAMRLKGSDEIVAAGVVDEARRGGTLIVVSANGYGKKTKLAEYKTQSRGGSGLLTAKLTPKTGKLVGGRVIADEAELIAISKQSQVIRTPLREIPTLGRQTQGVRVMKLRPGDQLASLTYL